MGEAARQSGAPKVPETPLELMTPRPGEGYSALDMYIWPVGGGITGFLTACARNLHYKRPFWAGIQLHIILTAVCGYAMTLVRDSTYAARSESDAVIKHYITLHPEDFPPFERKRFRDIYEPFQPIR